MNLQLDVLDGFKVLTPIDEFYIARVNPGLKGETDINGKTYRRTVTKVYPEVRDNKSEVEMLFDGAPPPGIRRGQTLLIMLEPGEKVVVRQFRRHRHSRIDRINRRTRNFTQEHANDKDSGPHEAEQDG